jgi:hypothetical protein
MLELLNQLDGFEATNKIKVRTARPRRTPSAARCVRVLWCARQDAAL